MLKRDLQPPSTAVWLYVSVMQSPDQSAGASGYSNIMSDFRASGRRVPGGPMAIREKMNHVAAGLLDSFYSRRNSLEGFWTLGVLYEEVQSEPHHVELDLLARAAIPPGPNALLIAARYGDFLQHALEKKGLRIEELTRASVTIQFKAKVSVPRSQPHWVGDSFSCTVTLQRMDRKVAYTANGKCMPNDPRLFSRGG